VKDPNELQAMNKGLLRHTVVLVQLQSSIETKDRINVLNSDKLSIYGQDDLVPLVFVARERLVELESENRFLLARLAFMANLQFIINHLIGHCNNQ
jgi:hypothetical protein